MSSYIDCVMRLIFTSILLAYFSLKFELFLSIPRLNSKCNMLIKKKRVGFFSHSAWKFAANECINVLWRHMMSWRPIPTKIPTKILFWTMMISEKKIWTTSVKQKRNDERMKMTSWWCRDDVTHFYWVFWKTWCSYAF